MGRDSERETQRATADQQHLEADVVVGRTSDMHRHEDNAARPVAVRHSVLTLAPAERGPRDLAVIKFVQDCRDIFAAAVTTTVDEFRRDGDLHGPPPLSVAR